MQAIGDRMKANYELPSRHELTRRVPVIIRVDGRAFHTYTRGMQRPFSCTLADAMIHAAITVGNEMQGFKAAYHQSDEVSFLLTDYDTHATEPWFGYIKSKLESVTASIMTAAFNRYSVELDPTLEDAHFDARAFSVPREEVANYFLWRMKDWERNSVSMLCRSHFSAKQMHGQGRADQHEMLHSVGVNWATDVSQRFRNGTWIFPPDATRSDVLPVYDAISSVLEPGLYVDRMTSED